MLKIATARNVFMISIIYVSLASLFVQFIFLQFLFPSFHGGNGLLLGFDMSTFHREASQMATLIDQDGLSKLTFTGSISGIASFFYYLTGIHEPFVVIPFNALVHSLSALLIFYLAKLILKDKVSAFLGAMVFIFLPTSLFWNTQLHKDGVFILGVFLFIFGFISILKNALSKKEKKYQVYYLMIFPVLGTIFSVSMRNYYAPLVEAFALLFFVFFNIFIFYKFRNFRKSLNSLLKLGLIFLTIILSNNFISHEHTLIKFKAFKPYSESNFEIQGNEAIIDNKIFNSTDVYTYPESNFEIQGNEAIIDNKIFNSTDVYTYTEVDPSSNIVIKLFLNSKNLLYKVGFYFESKLNFATNGLLTRRVKYIRKHGDTSLNYSNIDIERKLNSFNDIILYIPRAIQIGLGAPFPGEWFNSGSSNTTSIFRVINAFEMIIYYFSFIGIIILVYKDKESLLYTISFLTYALGNIIAFTVAIPNIGTLHRIRYGFVMLIVCLGCAQIIKLILKNIKGTSG